MQAPALYEIFMHVQLSGEIEIFVKALTAK
jgi:hypothetical protein